MNAKHCPRCNSDRVIRFGRSHGKQRYRCRDCKKTWTNKSRRARLSKLIWRDFALNGLSMKELSLKYHKSERTIGSYIKAHPYPVIAPSDASVIMMDATYFGAWGILTVLDAHTGRPLYISILEGAERVSDYETALLALNAAGVYPKACVIDRRRGVRQMLEHHGLKVQICQFHLIAYVNTCLTRQPVNVPEIELKDIILSLSRVDEATFFDLLADWKEKYQSWINDRSYVSRGYGKRKRWEYTHRLTRKAFNAIIADYPYLFTFEESKDLNIPKTTSLLEGRFGYIKGKLLNHRGASRQLKIKLIFSLLIGE